MPLSLPAPRALVETSRRAFLSDTGKATLSATAVALIAGCQSMAQTAGRADPMADVNILNVALGLEHEAIMAYQLGAESGLLQKPVLDVAVLFQSHHKAHADALTATVRKLGGRPVESKTKAEYATALNAASIRYREWVIRDST
jgi:malate/lactate dehydrogenase